MCKRPVKDAPLRLFCFPYAGGGVAAFRAWPDYLPHNVEVQMLEMPGREKHVGLPRFVRVGALVHAMAKRSRTTWIVRLRSSDTSMGALVSFELARLLRRQNSPQPDALFVSGPSRPPQLEIEPST
jgi:medium-chain acyl-[acyl-carrier-protein] hydrolase